LNFETTCRIKKLTAKNLRYEQFLQLDYFINSSPELQEVIRQGDFEPSRADYDRGLIITRPKVSFTSILPTGQEEGYCHIKFSTPLRRDLTIRLSFKDFRALFMRNTRTLPQWETRPFLNRLGDNAFDANLGSVTTTLSLEEAQDLCACIDEIADRYKESVIAEEKLLGTWDFEPGRVYGERAFRILLVSRELWDLMKRFANEFDYYKGDTEWHIFDPHRVGIRIGRGTSRHVMLYAIADEDAAHLPNGLVHILYYIPGWLFKRFERSDATWKGSVGLHGIWKADYTKQWLREKFIPKVLDYYRRERMVKRKLAGVYRQSSSEDRLPPLKDVQDVENLYWYTQDVQSWLSGPAVNIGAAPLRPYYESFTDLVRNSSLLPEQYEYVWGNFGSMSDDARCSAEGDAHEATVNCLDAQVKRIKRTEVELSCNAELISRNFLFLLREGNIKFTQQQLNAAKEALQPLWDQCQFERRYLSAEMW
jgi:hypothetical protein